MSDKEKKKEHSGLTDSIIGAATTENVERFGRAASEYLKGYKGTFDDNGEIVRKGLKQVAESKVHPDYEYSNIKQQAGFSAEIHYVDKTNAENIINKSDYRVHRSNDIGRGNDPQFDILSVDDSGNPTWGAQMKFYGKFETPEEIKKSSEELVRKMTKDDWERYRGNDVLVPKEQYEIAKKYAEDKARELSEQAEKLRAQGQYDKADLLDQNAEKYRQVSHDLKDSGITTKEAVFLREHPQLATAKYVLETAHRAGLENAKSAAVVSAVISTAQNVVSLIRGEKRVGEALKDVTKDTASGAVTAYIIGAGDTAIRGFMAASSNSVFVNLSKTNMPAMIATATVQVGKSLIRYAKGEIDSLELVEELGEKGTGMMAASFGAAIGTAVFPGVGTVIGGMVGYLVSSSVYKACMQTLREERLFEERRVRIHAIATAAIEAMGKQGNELLAMIEKFYARRQQVFAEAITMLNLASNSQNIELFTQGLNKIAIEMGGALQFKNFSEFDSFMQDKNTALEF
ncbi:hypothetical protein P4U99_07565 [Brevibacillus agri]|uniref:hypothetical protein n=1 Tax=Brevibacillus TaxID=55080 RepID=UPI002E1ED310|nr:MULTISPECIES: hypothetical protein [Brevibacillus]MED1643046.1 hypothetical protein [Brevibacillus agri]MED2011266.1 hypothetical protein [Brevibacillus borstelensis]MED1653652.1 hypothetical protein [Brevibacillus agri]MED1687303.1 hypothetical protein [Brevibacillus agri]MED1693876.1 hypothetical protein [Brevibacillus agri]